MYINVPDIGLYSNNVPHREDKRKSAGMIPQGYRKKQWIFQKLTGSTPHASMRRSGTAVPAVCINRQG